MNNWQPFRCADCDQIIDGSRYCFICIQVLKEKLALAIWQPIETCPDNTTVLFWDNGPRIGRMEHNTLRMGGYRQEHFWGDLFDDDQPPTHWMPLPDPPTARERAL